MVLSLAVISSGPCAAATFQIPDSALPEPLVFIAYGDTRFTAASETAASSPAARQALIAKIAAESPAAIFINGDLPYHGIAADYEVYRTETQAWRDKHLRVYPALGNHELSACFESSCLDRWWSAFPELRGRRWYSVAVGSRLIGIALDSDASLLPGSEQRAGQPAERGGHQGRCCGEHRRERRHSSDAAAQVISGGIVIGWSPAAPVS